MDSKLQEQIQEQEEYWKEVLERIVAVITTLAERKLAFPETERCLAHLGIVTTLNC